MDVNVITFSADCIIIGDGEPVVDQFDFDSKEAVFTKLKSICQPLKVALCALSYRWSTNC
jgi:hypothetical protein